MANRPASFFTQAKALFLKNLTLQKRDMRTNLGLVSFPVLLLLLLLTIQQVINHVGHKMDGVENQICASPNASDTERRAANCPGVKPLEKPALLQVPPPGHRAVRTDSTVTFQGLPDSSCRRNGSCPVTLLLTGTNRTLGESLGRNLFSTSFPTNSSSDNHLYILANLPLGEEAFSSSESDDSDSLQTVEHGDEDEEASVSYFLLQPQCTENSRLPVPLKNVHLQCLQSLALWRNSSSAMNDELFKGFVKPNSNKEGNEYMAAFDFLNTSEKNFNVSISYNGTLELMGGAPRLMNLASNAFLQFLRGAGVKVLLDFVEDMPQPAVPMLRIDVSSSISGIFYAWVILFLFPVILTTLVYEKQQNQNIRIMMKMHGLGDGPYWMITYAYFLIVSLIYVLLFVVFGSLIGLKFFTLNDYGIQFVFYFVCINLQIALAFLVATFFSNVKTATVTAYLYAFASGLLGENLFRPFTEDLSFPRRWVIIMELIPGFSLYRGIYEFIQCSDLGTQMGISGMRWKDLNDYTNGLKEVYIIMIMEWLIVLSVAYYMDQVMLSGSGVRKHPLFFLKKFCKKASPSLRRSSLPKEGSHVDEMEKSDVSQETQKVQELLRGGSTSHVLISDNIGKVYPGKDGNQEKTAVKGLSLAVRRGECFGLLGPNGAGKTSWFSMMTGLTAPTSGTAFVQGFDIRTDMDKVYTSMGVCPQHDLLWETLTGREHLLFYGRLRNLKGEALTQAVEDSLKSVNLEAFGDKQSSQYSGGMKRRLSVAISLIGDPQVVYMDEPSTGLDPASRNLLWNAVKRAKRDRAIVLTTHSMEEAEALCDRLGIFVDGSLQCIGNSKELKGRYGGSYVFTMTTSSNAEELVEAMVHRLSPSAKKIYQLSGTQKFEMPKEEVRIADVFLAVERAKSRCTIQAWGLVDTTLEDVFIKVAQGAHAFKVSTSSFS